MRGIDELRAYRWAGTTDRITLEVEHQGVWIALELGVLDVHVEPDEAPMVIDAVSRETAAPGSISEFAVLKLCRLINGA